MRNSDVSRRLTGSAGSILSIGSSGSILSIGSSGSILSIGSAGSILSIGSACSLASMLSIGSFASAGSVLSGLSLWSNLAWRSRRPLIPWLRSSHPGKALPGRVPCKRPRSAIRSAGTRAGLVNRSAQGPLVIGFATEVCRGYIVIQRRFHHHKAAARHRHPLRQARHDPRGRGHLNARRHHPDPALARHTPGDEAQLTSPDNSVAADRAGVRRCTRAVRTARTGRCRPLWSATRKEGEMSMPVKGSAQPFLTAAHLRSSTRARQRRFLRPRLRPGSPRQQ